MVNPFHIGQQPQNDLLNKVYEDQKVSYENLLKQIALIGDNLSKLKSYYYDHKTTLITVQTYETTFNSDGYQFNSIFVSDAQANASLVISYEGVTWTQSLVAGENTTNIPNGATYKTTGASYTALLKTYNMLR